MQSAETVTEILRARGRRGLPCDELYRQLFNPALFLMAWGRIYANDGAMTPGRKCGLVKLANCLVIVHTENGIFAHRNRISNHERAFL